MSSNNNLRIPQIMLPGTYPYVSFTQTRCGNWSREDSTPSNESLAVGHRTGAVHEYDNSGGHKHLVLGDRWTYGQGGSSETVEKNDHKVVGGSTVHQIQGDSHSENAGSHYHGIGADKIHAVSGSHFNYAGKQEDAHTESHVINTNDGDNHHNILGDHIVYIGGTKYQSISGEYGIYVPNGNIDMTASGNGQIQSTNFTLNTSANTLLNALINANITAGANVVVTANQDIILTCNALIINVGNSSITMNSSGLTFSATAINFNQIV